MNLTDLTIIQASQDLRSGKYSSVDLTKACLKRIKSVDAKLHACLLVDEKGALAQAEEADKRLKQGSTSELLGIPYLAKDNILTKGLSTTAGSKMLENYIAPYDATVIKKLKKAGAVLLGKTNLDEFAHGSSTENSAFGLSKNPYDLNQVPGGSSGGSAVAVAAGLCLFALGSDTGGSIRQPASFCGLVGLRPTYGRVPRHGLVAMSSSIDVIGPLTKTASDNLAVLKVISGADDFDATAISTPLPKVRPAKNKKQVIKIGLITEFLNDLGTDTRKVIDKAVSDFRSVGYVVEEVSLPHIKLGIPVYYILVPAEISSNLARLDGLRYGYNFKSAGDLEDEYLKNRSHGFGPEAKRRIMLGTYVLSSGYQEAYYKKAQAVKMLIRKELLTALTKYNFLIGPTTPHTAFKIGANKDPLSMYLEDIYAAGSSLAGVPSLSVPAGLIKNLPYGLQIMAAPQQDVELLQLAETYEKVRGHLDKKLAL